MTLDYNFQNCYSIQAHDYFLTVCWYDVVIRYNAVGDARRCVPSSNMYIVVRVVALAPEKGNIYMHIYIYIYGCVG